MAGTLPQPPAGGTPNAQLAAGFGVGITTVYRYVTEAGGLLAALAPDLAEAARAASRKAFVILTLHFAHSGPVAVGLLPGLLTAPRTGLPPAGGKKLTTGDQPRLQGLKSAGRAKAQG